MDVPDHHFPVLNELKKKTASSESRVLNFKIMPTVPPVTPAEYTPVYWDGDLPSPEGLYGKAIHDSKTPADQRHEATQLFDFLHTSDGECNHDILCNMKSPAPFLIQVPHTNKVRFICGIAPYRGDPFSSQPTSNVEGKLLGLLHEPAIAGETPTVAELPEELLHLHEVTLPTEKEFTAKLEAYLEQNKDDDGTPWFKESNVKATFKLPSAMPCPAYLAYDAFMDDIAAPILWERIKVEEASEQCTELFQGIKAFLMAANTKHNKGKGTVAIPTRSFTQRANPDALTWGRARQEMLFPSLKVVTAPATPQRNEVNTLLKILAQKDASSPTSVTVVPDPETECVKKFGMCTTDLNHILKLCGLIPGQEELLPPWIKEMAVKQLTKDGKQRIIREMCTKLRYEDNPIPLYPAIYKMVQDKAFGGDDDTHSATAAMKGLSPYLMVEATASEIEEENELANAIENATSTTVKDLQNLSKRKAVVPGSFTILIAVLRTFANFLCACFGARCRLLMELVHDVISPLALMRPQAKANMAATTRASIMWATLLQTKHFARGKMVVGREGLIGEWKTMTNNIASTMNINFLGMPSDIAGTAQILPALPPPIKALYPALPKRPRGGEHEPWGEERQHKKGGKPSGHDDVKYAMIVHPLIKEKLTPLVPKTVPIKKLLEIAGIRRTQDIFPGTNICVNGAIKGSCIYQQCKNIHDGTRVTDDMAKTAISLLDKVIQNPHLIQHSSNYARG
jgi:hypothetical protein